MNTRPALFIGATAVGLATAALLALTPVGTDRRSDTTDVVHKPPACTSCDARHARLADLRAKQSERTE
jgi:hypothetical protein